MKIEEFAEKQHIVWNINPPSSPQMGGSWKRLVRVLKTSMFNIVKDGTLADLQMVTAFTEVENMVNNRPITKSIEK